MPPRRQCAREPVTLPAKKTPPLLPVHRSVPSSRPHIDFLVWPRSALRYVIGNATAPRPRRIAAALRFGASRLAATLRYSPDRPCFPVYPRRSTLVTVRASLRGHAQRQALRSPQAVSRFARPYLAPRCCRVALLPSLVTAGRAPAAGRRYSAALRPTPVSLRPSPSFLTHSEDDNTAATPPSPLRYANSAGRCTSLPAEPFVPTSLRAICRRFAFDPAQLARSVSPAPAGRPQAEELLRAYVTGTIPPQAPERTRTLRPSAAPFPLREQNHSLILRPRFCPLRPLYFP